MKWGAFLHLIVTLSSSGAGSRLLCGWTVDAMTYLPSLLCVAFRSSRTKTATDCEPDQKRRCT